MNKILLTALASVGVLALAGCADDTTTTRTRTYDSSTTTVSSDSKNMTGETMTRSTVQPAPPPADTNTVTDPNAIPYPAIHSNGQHF